MITRYELDVLMETIPPNSMTLCYMYYFLLFFRSKTDW